MSDSRLPGPRSRRRSRSRFRCLVCSRFVVATEHGVCPRCGLGPPEPLRAPTYPEPGAWRRARVQARRLGVGGAYWGWVALFAIAVGAVSAALALRIL